MKYLLLAALLAQAPSPKPTSSLPIMIDNRANSPSVWNMGCEVMGKKADRCLDIMVSEFGKELFTITHGDGPTKGGCDLGNLVRATRKHLALEHAHTPPQVVCGVYDNLRFISSQCKDVPMVQDEFASWEVCGNEYAQPSFDSLTTLRNVPMDPAGLRKMADCLERREAKRAKEAKAKALAEQERDKAMADLRMELDRCEPKKQESK